MDPKYDFKTHAAIVKEYPYCSEYLYSLILDQGIMDTHYILDITDQIQDWLGEYVYRDGKNNYRWDDNGLTTTLLSGTGNEVIFCSVLRFRFEEDLIAFKLKFGIAR